MPTVRLSFFVVMIFCSITAIGGDKALVTSMKKVKCGAPVAKFTVMEALIGSNPVTPDLSCLEFTLRTSRVQYRLRPSRQMLLPVGSTVAVRVDKKHVMVQIEDTKEVRCEVVSMDLLDEYGRPIEPRETEGFPMPPVGPSYASRTPHVVPPSTTRNCLTMDGDVVPCGGN